MTDTAFATQAVFDTSLELWLYVRPSGMDEDEWQEFEQGPGRFSIQASFDAGIRIKNIDDLILLHLVDEIAKCPAVVYLNLAENRKITDEGLRRLAGLTQLRILNLSSCDITDRGLSWLENLKHLKILNLSYCNRLNDAGLKCLRSLTDLTHLDLQGCPRIHHAAIIKTLARRGLNIHE